VRKAEQRLPTSGPDAVVARPIDQAEFDVRLASDPVDLTQVDFAASVLSWPQNLSLRRAKLAGCRLGRDFRFPSTADLTEADFSEADLSEADLRNVGSLETTNFSGAKLNSAKLAGCRFSRARFVGAVLDRANLEGAVLQRANLTRANLRHALLTGANLDHADLTDAGLEGVNSLQLDATILDGTRFMPGCREPWLELVRAFSGFNLFLHVLGLALFAAPLALQATILTVKAGIGDIVCSNTGASGLTPTLGTHG